MGNLQMGSRSLFEQASSLLDDRLLGWVHKNARLFLRMERLTSIATAGIMDQGDMRQARHFACELSSAHDSSGGVAQMVRATDS
jgi:hypothetical protein